MRRGRCGGIGLVEYEACIYLERFNLCLLGAMDSERAVTLCVEPFYRDDVPGVPLGDSPEETLARVIALRNSMISELKSNTTDSHRIYTDGCADCMLLRKSNWADNGLIEVINLSMYPAPCNSKCSHCLFAPQVHDRMDQKSSTNYEKALHLAEYAKKNGYTHKNVFWQVATGEITVHPYKDRILSLIGDDRCQFLSNCFLYDDGIAKNLEANPKSQISLTLNAGTPRVYRGLTGVDNFDSVLENISRYRKASSPGQIHLKYIVFPGINDNAEDFEGVIRIMKNLQIDKLAFMRDSRRKYNTPASEMEKVIESTARGVSFLIKNGLGFDLFYYYPEQMKQIVAITKEMRASTIC